MQDKIIGKMFHRQMILIFLCLLSILSGVAAAEDDSAIMFKYVDKNGTTCFTDSIQNIPETYRKNAAILNKNKETQLPYSSFHDMPAEDTGEIPGAEKKEPSYKNKFRKAFKGLTESRFFRPVMIVILTITSFILIGKVARFFRHKLIGSVIRIVIILGVLIYFFGSYTKEAANTFDSMKDSVLGIKKQTEERNQEIEDATKTLFGNEKPQK